MTSGERQRRSDDFIEEARAKLRATITGFEEDLRAEVRAMMARANVNQRELAAFLGVSQSSVSHMLTDRVAGLSAVEIYAIEHECGVRPGTLYRKAHLAEELSLEEQVYELPGITAQAAEAIVAAIQAVRAHHLRTTGETA